uniref:Uncharacterized protein n=1 Tax=Glossina pallidipes TaxID=7398 RepID=A0A1A9ZRR3_GLOPL
MEIMQICIEIAAIGRTAAAATATATASGEMVVAILDDMLDVIQGSAAARYMYGLAGAVYGQGAAPTLELLKVLPIVPGSIELFMLTATPLAPVMLHQACNPDKEKKN